jgi:hypothetical protein
MGLLHRKSIDFIIGLDQRLHEIKDQKCIANMSGTPFLREYDAYNIEEKMESIEVERLLSIVKKSPDLVIFPLQTPYGFGVDYEVGQLNLKGGKTLLRFKGKQMPEEYNWVRMSETFLSSPNRVKAFLYGAKFSTCRWDYEG